VCPRHYREREPEQQALITDGGRSLGTATDRGESS
jgi:hypothetical protein